MNAHPADVFQSIADEPEIKQASVALPQVQQYEIVEAIEAFNRMMGLPSLTTKARPSFTREFTRWRARFHRSEA